MKQCLLLLFLLLTACSAPSPYKVNEAIGRGQIGTAVVLLTELLNREAPITSRKLDSLLDALSVSRKFNLDLADQLFEGLKPNAKQVILRWYIGQYLQMAEAAIQRDRYDIARIIWTRHQKIRQAALPEFQESTPVMGIIDLREAEYWIKKRQLAKARSLYVSARSRLTYRRPFDRVEQYAFRNLIQDIHRKLY